MEEYATEFLLTAHRATTGDILLQQDLAAMDLDFTWKLNIRLADHMGLRQNSGMDRPAVIQTYGSVWITCVLVWIGGMDRSVGPRYGSGLYILTRSHMKASYPFDLRLILGTQELDDTQMLRTYVRSGQLEVEVDLHPTRGITDRLDTHLCHP